MTGRSVQELRREPRQSDRKQSSDSVQILRPSDLAPTIALFSSVLLAFSFTYIDWQPISNGRYYDWVLQSLSIGSPFFAALGLGAVRKVHQLAYLLLGFVAGCGGFAQMLVLYALGRLDRSLQTASSVGSGYVIALPNHWYLSLLIYSVIGSICCLVGGRLGGRSLLLGASKTQDEDSTGTPVAEMPKWLQTLLISFGTTIVTGVAGAIVKAIFPHSGSSN